MPGGDGTGPLGIGPRSGRAAHFCAGFEMPGFMNPAGFGYGFGRGGGRGFGRFCRTAGWRNWWSGGAYQGLEAGTETKMLEDRIRYMEQDLDQAKKRLAELQKGPNQAE
jgi:hypothetical protein